VIVSNSGVISGPKDIARSARRQRRQVWKRLCVRDRPQIEFSDRSLKRFGLKPETKHTLIELHADAPARSWADDLEKHVPQDDGTALKAWKPRDRHPRRQP